MSSYSPEELDSELDTLSADIVAVVDKLSSPSALSMPFDEMLSLEQNYKQLVQETNDLLQTREVLLGLPCLEQDANLSLLYDSRADLEDEISNAGYYGEVGSLSYYPVTGRTLQVNSNYGSRWDPVSQKRYAYHHGIDLRAASGTPIGAWFSGQVYKTGYDTGCGNYIWLDHGHGVKTFYCHLSEVRCSKGQTVKQGSIIALSGNTGTQTTGPHLHLGLYIDGSSVDPLVVLTSQ